jgi:shikimate dehydrogenase
VVGVVGFPVRHSLSPLLHNCAFGVLGLDWSYVAFEVPPRSLESAVSGARSLGLRGLSVTMPHKDAAARLAARRSMTVRRLGAANTLVFEPKGVFAESTDGEGLLDDLREGARFDPDGRHCAVIGAGGAGRAAVLALAEAGAESIVIVNRSRPAAWRSAALAPNVARVGRPDELIDMDLVVQATPASMSGVGLNGAAPGRFLEAPERGDDVSAAIAGVDPLRFGSGQLVVDLVYDPPLTPFLLEARRKGANVRNGLGMLVHQAARQIEIWTGAEPPVSDMWAVVGGDASGALGPVASEPIAAGPTEA